MKVSTDACILGAYVQPQEAKTILDIGTGTGLLALMLAQKAENSQIDALEIELNAYAQAKTNFQKSPWANRLFIKHQSLQTYARASDRLYELILCNPPFFQKHLKSLNEKKNLALHNDQLPFTDLIQGVIQLLSAQGSLWVMYPSHEMNIFKTLAIQCGLYCYHTLTIFNKADTKVFRKICGFRLQAPQKVAEHQLTIRCQDGSYTPDFKNLLKDYYL